VQQYNGELNLFSPFIWKYQYDFEFSKIETKIRHLFSLVEKNSILESGDALSTVSLHRDIQPHSWKEFEKFQQWLGYNINCIKESLKFKNKHSEVINSWANLHKQGGYTLEHNHSNVFFVVSCYLKCPENSGNIEFKDPLEYHYSGWPIETDIDLYKEVKVSTNDVLIFPGWLRHRVQPNLTNEDRIVLTFNIQ
jgi:uncharacterized protein (TIGR02466 family)